MGGNPLGTSLTDFDFITTYMGVRRETADTVYRLDSILCTDRSVPWRSKASCTLGQRNPVRDQNSAISETPGSWAAGRRIADTARTPQSTLYPVRIGAWRSTESCTQFRTVLAALMNSGFACSQPALPLVKAPSSQPDMPPQSRRSLCGRFITKKSTTPARLIHRPAIAHDPDWNIRRAFFSRVGAHLKPGEVSKIRSALVSGRLLRAMHHDCRRILARVLVARRALCRA